MEYFAYVIIISTRILLHVIFICMFVRAILTFMQSSADNFLTRAVYAVSEVVIRPVRYFMMRLNILQGSRIDMSFSFSMLIIIILLLLLPQ